MASLSSIPPEIQLHISKDLQYSSLGRLNRTSKYFNALLDDELLGRACKERLELADKIKQALHYAVGFNDHDRIRKILAHGNKAGLDLVNTNYDQKYTMWDAQDEIVKGATPLEHSLKKTFDLPVTSDTVEYLLHPPGVARDVDPKTVKLLIDEGANINAHLVSESHERYALPILHRAVSIGNVEILQTLFDHGAASHINTAWASILHRAMTKRSDTAVFRLLLEHGADIQAKAPGGKFPLHTALDRDDFDNASLLLEWGAKINGKDGKGRTPLMCAAQCGSLKAVKWLLARRADIQVHSRTLGTAERIAETGMYLAGGAEEEKEYEAIVVLLKKRKLDCKESMRKEYEFKEKQKPSRTQAR